MRWATVPPQPQGAVLGALGKDGSPVSWVYPVSCGHLVSPPQSPPWSAQENDCLLASSP